MNKDLYKTIKGLKLCTTNQDVCNECPYVEYNTEGAMEESCIQKLMEDSLELLIGKRQTKEIGLLDEFIQFAKDEYGVEIMPEQSKNPDTFKNVFGCSFIEECEKYMRPATLEERECIQNHIEKISHKTSVNFWDELEKSKKK